MSGRGLGTHYHLPGLLGKETCAWAGRDTWRAPTGLLVCVVGGPAP